MVFPETAGRWRDQMRFSVLPMGIPRLGCEAIPSTYDRTPDGDMIDDVVPMRDR